MDDRRAEQILELARAVNRARSAADREATTALRAASDAIEPAAMHLLRSDAVAALELVAALSGFWQDAGLVDDGRRIAASVVSSVRARPSADGAAPARSRELVDAELALAELAFRQGDQAAAADNARRAIDGATVLEDGPLASLGWSMLARVAFREEDGEAMEVAGAKALELAGDDDLARRGAMHMLAWAAHTRGDVDEARRRFEASLAYRRERGAGPLSEAVEIANIADLDLDAGKIASAAAALAEVLETARSLDNLYLLVNTLPSAAAVAAAAGEDEIAAALFGSLDGLAASTGLIPDPGGDRIDVRRAVASRLGAERFEGSAARGRGLDAAAAFARAIAACRSVAGRPEADG